MKVYKTVLNEASAEMIEKKSRFICYVSPVNDEPEALEFVKKISDMNRDATHNVFAYVIAGNVEIQRASDDGEPQGTAGIPVLEVIKKENLVNVCAVVTRYFGGILLGAGGLIRAYSQSAREGLKAAQICTMGPYTKLKVKVNYTSLGKIQNSMNHMGNNIINTEYSDSVTIFIRVKLSKVESTIKAITEMTYGSAEIDQLDKYYDVYEME